MNNPSPELLCYDFSSDVIAFTTTRQGGCSKGNYASFNINSYCGDDPEDVSVNRANLCRKLGITEEYLIMPHQKHHTHFLPVDESFLHSEASVRKALLEDVDAVMTDVAGVCVGVSTADCIPVLLCDSTKKVVCAIHAGWRGTCQRIVEKTLLAMRKTYGCLPQDIQACIGPGISQRNFEVGDEVYEAFSAGGFEMSSIARYTNKWHIDLWACNKMQLMTGGVPERSIRCAGICTCQETDKYFSARRLTINSGRLFSGIMMVKHD